MFIFQLPNEELFYCGKLEFKIPRHCEINHKAKELVAKALLERKCRPKRKVISRTTSRILKTTLEQSLRQETKITQTQMSMYLALSVTHFSTREPCTNTQRNADLKWRYNIMDNNNSICMPVELCSAFILTMINSRK